MTPISRRAATIRARTRCSKRLRADCRLRYLRSGGHPELVGEGGLGFDAPDELPAVLARLRDELDERRRAIRVPLLDEVADRYLEVLRA